MFGRRKSMGVFTLVAGCLLFGFPAVAHATDVVVDAAHCAANTDDTEYFQGLIDGHGGPVVIPDNCTLELNRMLRLSSGTSISGAGSGSVLKFVLPTTLGGTGTFTGNSDKDCATYFGWHNSGGIWSNDPSFIRTVQASPQQPPTNITLLSFHAIGCTRGFPSGPSTGPYPVQQGIQMLNTHTFSVKHVEVEKTPSIGIQYKDATDGEISYNSVHNTGRDGITGFYTLGTTALDANMTLTGNVIKYVGDDGMSVNVVNPDNAVTANGVLPHGFTFTNNRIYGRPNPDDQQATDTTDDRLPRGRGLVMSASGATYTNNTVNNTVGDGILVVDNVGLADGSTRPDDVTFTGTIVSRAGQATPGWVSPQFGDLRRKGVGVENAKTVTIGATNSTATSYAGPLYVLNCVTCSVSLAAGSN